MTTDELSTWQPRLQALASAACGDDGAHDINHLQRVWRNAQALLASHPDADALAVMAACYLHDLVNLPKNHPERGMASRRSAELARRELAAIGFPDEKLDTVAHAIETHSFSAALQAHSIEAKLVQDADRLDALGAVGLARLFYIAGQMGSALAHPDDPLAEHRERDDRAYALDHIEVKLARLPGMMQTAAGRALGAARLAQLTTFRAAFAQEWTLEPIPVDRSRS
ncbi:HD domain-containing protein [Massilia sp. CCM 8734]|uniref:HD domain-containing protein n=1 Tax=Massilia sp. CCM 8734 TaxID=2609283 RepID=UPI001423271F|nr:HD domain-containing protein [Massilia sp. CCM 8734]NHZ98663.1 HD domain-containing protein [Massilia sp. CCM 8734]